MTTTAITYRISFYRWGQAEPVKVEEYTGLHEGSVQVMVDEWREWTNGTATYEVVSLEVPAEENTTEVAEFTVKYGNDMGNGTRSVFYTRPWEYRPMAERDLSWKRADGWSYAELVQVPSGWDWKGQPIMERGC